MAWILKIEVFSFFLRRFPYKRYSTFIYEINRPKFIIVKSILSSENKKTI